MVVASAFFLRLRFPMRQRFEALAATLRVDERFDVAAREMFTSSQVLAPWSWLHAPGLDLLDGALLSLAVRPLLMVSSWSWSSLSFLRGVRTARRRVGNLFYLLGRLGRGSWLLDDRAFNAAFAARATGCTSARPYSHGCRLSARPRLPPLTGSVWPALILIAAGSSYRLDFF